MIRRKLCTALKWIAPALLCAAGPSVARDATPRTITLSETFLYFICAGSCDGSELQAVSDGTVRVRKFNYGDHRLRYEAHYRVSPERFAAFEHILATIRPASKLWGHVCDHEDWSHRAEVRWRGGGAPSNILGCFSGRVPRDIHLSCTRTRALIALGFEPLMLRPSEDPDLVSLNGCEAERFEALLPTGEGAFSPEGTATRTITYAIWCAQSCRRYWFRIDSAGRGLFHEAGDDEPPLDAVFAVTPAEFAAFEAALASYRRKGDRFVNFGDLDCVSTSAVSPSLQLDWADRYDQPGDELGIAGNCDGRFRPLYEAPALLLGLRPLIARGRTAG